MKVPVANMNSTTMQEYVAELLNSIFDVQTRKKVHMTSVLENKPKVSFFCDWRKPSSNTYKILFP